MGAFTHGRRKNNHASMMEDNNSWIEIMGMNYPGEQSVQITSQLEKRGSFPRMNFYSSTREHEFTEHMVPGSQKKDVASELGLG
jgi:hypothetical protein